MRGAVEARGRNDIALNAGLWIVPCLYFAGAGCLALALYEFLQPARYPNPTIPAVEQSASTVPFVLVMEAEARSSGADALALAMEPNVKAKDGAQQPPKRPAKPDRATSTVDTSKARRAQARARDPAMDHAAQPAFGYRPWGNYQTRSNNWGWDNYRAWDNYHPGGNYQTGGSRQTFSGYQSRH